MSFDDNAYLKWYVPKLSPFSDAINLHSSGMPPVRAGEVKPPAATGFEMLGLVEERLAKNAGIPKEELVFTAGATGGTLLALLALGGERRRFVVETPIYEPMMQQARRLGEVAPLPRTFENRWQIDLERAEATIDDDTSVVLITEPSNPSGVFSSRESVAALAEICRRRGAVLLINEVYLGYSKRKSLHRLADNVVIVNSYSKLLGAYANRVGWVSGPADLMGRLRWAGLNMGTNSVPGAAVGIGFARQAARRTEEARRKAAGGLGTVERWVAGCPAIDWIPPEGPGFGAVRLPPGVDDLELVNRLYEERSVLAVPGTLFFAPGILRISWLGAGERLQEGLDIIAETLARRQLQG